VRALVLALLVACNSSATAPVRRAPAPDDAVGILIDTFWDRPIVALDEGGHGNTATHEYISRVIRDPRAAGVVNDLVVEWGSAKYQATIDAFVAGGDVSDDELRKVWQETTQVLVWESPLYEKFFRAVREVNAKLPAAKRFRVVLADPPIEWSAVQSWGDWARMKRDAHAAAVIEREVLARQRKALVVFGSMHLTRGNGMLADEIEQRHPSSLFTIYATPPDEPAKAMCTGEEEFCPEYTLKVEREGTFDAKLVAGGEVTYAEPPPVVFADEAYYRETVRRSHILHDVALAEIEALRAKYLASCSTRAAC